MKIAALTFCLALSLGTNAAAQNFFFDSWAPRSVEAVPLYEEGTAPTAAPTVTITLTPGDTIAPVSPRVYGNNAVVWQGQSHNNATRMRHYRNAGLSVLRYPGGSMSDTYFWNVAMAANLPADIGPMYGNGNKDPQANDDYWKLTPNDFYTMASQLGTETIITINYGYARYGTSENRVAKAAHLAAEWVREVNIRRGLGIKYWEIGNESYGDWEAGNTIPGKGVLTGAQYGRDFKVFVDSMKAVDPTIKIGAVTVDLPTSYNNNFNRWNETLFPEIKDVADFLAVHHYFFPVWPPRNYTPAQLVGKLGNVSQIKTWVSNMWQTHAGTPVPPLAMTEFNIFAEESFYETGHMNSVFSAMVLGELIKNKYGLANMWDLHNGWNNGADHGMLSKGAPGVADDSPQGTFFTFYYYDRVFGDVMIKTATTNANIRAYASRFSSGETGLVIVNPTATAQTVQFAPSALKPNARYYWWEVQNNDPASRKLGINGQWTTQQGGGPLQYEDVKAFSLPASSNIVLDARPYSVNYILVETKEGVALDGEPAPGSPEEFRVSVYPNPASGSATLQLAIPAGAGGEGSLAVYDLLGRRVHDVPFTAAGGTVTTETLDLGTLPSGSYLLRATLGSHTATTRLVVAR